MRIRRMLFACWIPTATHTHTLRICNTYCFSTATNVTRRHFCVTLIVQCLHCCGLYWTEANVRARNIHATHFFQLNKGAQISEEKKNWPKLLLKKYVQLTNSPKSGGKEGADKLELTGGPRSHTWFRVCVFNTTSDDCPTISVYAVFSQFLRRDAPYADNG